jgi:hypothetical protein
VSDGLGYEFNAVEGSLMRKVLIWSVRVLGALLLVAFLLAAGAVGRAYWRATDGMPDHRLVDGASSWHGCIRPEDRRVEFVPLNAIPANAINAFLVVANEPDFLTREPYNPITDVLRRLWRGRLLGVKGGWASLGKSAISVAYVNQLLFCPTGDTLLHYRIERDLPRRSILETVINTDYFQSGAYGMPAAALTYSQRPLTELWLFSRACVRVPIPMACQEGTGTYPWIAATPS